MDDLRPILESIGDRFEMSEPAMERLLRHRERRARRSRVMAALVGLAVGVGGLGGVLLLLQTAGGSGSAAGGSAAAAADGGDALVLPILAVWLGVAVLGATAIAMLRRSVRFAGPVPGPERGSGSSGWEAGAAVTDRAPVRKGVDHMDTRSKTSVGRSPTEMPPMRLDEERLPRANRWLAVLVVVLAFAVVALGVALIREMNSEPAAPPPTPLVQGPADASTQSLVDDFLAALNTRDAAVVVDQYLPDATYWVNGSVYEGRSAIRASYEELFAAITNLEVERVGTVIRSGDVATFLVHDSNDTYMTWVFAFEDGKVAAHWITY